MSGFAVRRRRLQFEAGPETHVFYACKEHESVLGVGTTDVPCFFPWLDEPPEPVDQEEEMACDFCREG